MKANLVTWAIILGLVVLAVGPLLRKPGPPFHGVALHGGAPIVVYIVNDPETTIYSSELASVEFDSDPRLSAAYTFQPLRAEAIKGSIWMTQDGTDSSVEEVDEDQWSLAVKVDDEVIHQAGQISIGDFLSQANGHQVIFVVNEQAISAPHYEGIEDPEALRWLRFYGPLTESGHFDWQGVQDLQAALGGPGQP